MTKEQQTKPKKITPLNWERFEIENIDYENKYKKDIPTWKGWETWEDLGKLVRKHGFTEWEAKKTVAAIRYLFPDWEDKAEDERLAEYKELFKTYPLGVALHRSERKRGYWCSLLPVFE